MPESRSCIFRNEMYQKHNRAKDKSTIELNEDFYSDLEDLYFLLNNAENLEKQ